MQCYSLPWHSKVVKTYSNEAPCSADGFDTVYLNIVNFSSFCSYSVLITFCNTGSWNDSMNLLHLGGI